MPDRFGAMRTGPRFTGHLSGFGFGLAWLRIDTVHTICGSRVYLHYSPARYALLLVLDAAVISVQCFANRHS